MVMQNDRIALTLDLVGKLAPSVSQAFRRAGGMFDGVGRRVKALAKEERGLREELAKVREARRKAFEGGASDLARYDRQIERLNASLATTSQRLETATRTEARRQRIFRGAATAGAAVVGGGAAIGTAVNAAVNARARQAAEIDRAAQFGQVGTTQLQELANLLVAGNLTDRAGATQETGDALREIQNRIGDFESGSISDAFAALGLDQQAFAGAFAQNPVAALREQFGEAFQNVQNAEGSERATFLSEEIFGGTEARLILPLITQSVEEYAETARRAAREPIIAPDQLDALLEVRYATRRVETAVGGLTVELTEGASPAVVAFKTSIAETVEGVTAWIGENEGLKQSLGTAYGVIGTVGGAIGQVIPVLGSLGFALVGVKAAWGALNLAFLVSPIGLIILGIIAAVAALVAIGYVVYRNWDTILGALKGAWDAVRETIGGVIDAVKGKWNDLVETIFSTFRAVISPILSVASAIGGVFGLDTSALREVETTLARIQDNLTLETRDNPSGTAADARGGLTNNNISQTNYVTVNGVESPEMAAMMVADEVAAQTAR